MSFWSWVRRRLVPTQQPRADSRPRSGAIPLPTEPFVFECRVCHKVFEARRRRPLCPECDSPDVELMSA